MAAELNLTAVILSFIHTQLPSNTCIITQSQGATRQHSTDISGLIDHSIATSKQHSTALNMDDGDELDAMLTGGDEASSGGSQVKTEPVQPAQPQPASVAAPSAASTREATPPAAAGSYNPPAKPAQPAAADEDEDEDDDDEDEGINLVLDAPSAAASGPQRGFGMRVKPTASKWSQPGATAAATAAGGQSATGASASMGSTGAMSGAAAPLPSSSPSSSSYGRDAGPSSASHPYRLPMPNERLFQSGAHIDTRIDRPWTQPGADPSDWFNYGFDEETWKAYCQKQIAIRMNAQMKGKLTVYDPDEDPSQLQPRGGGGGQRGGAGGGGAAAGALQQQAAAVAAMAAALQRQQQQQQYGGQPPQQAQQMNFQPYAYQQGAQR